MVVFVVFIFCCFLVFVLGVSFVCFGVFFVVVACLVVFFERENEHFFLGFANSCCLSPTRIKDDLPTVADAFNNGTLP